MYNLAERCLDNYPSLRTVIIVKRPPRFDEKITSDLSEFANEFLDDLLVFITDEWVDKIPELGNLIESLYESGSLHLHK